MRSDLEDVSSEDYNINSKAGKYLSEALKWLSEGKRSERYNIPDWKIDVATIAKEINFAVESMRMPTHTSIRQLLA